LVGFLITQCTLCKLARWCRN